MRGRKYGGDEQLPSSGVRDRHHASSLRSRSTASAFSVVAVDGGKEEHTGKIQSQGWLVLLEEVVSMLHLDAGCRFNHLRNLRRLRDTTVFNTDLQPARGHRLFFNIRAWGRRGQMHHSKNKCYVCNKQTLGIFNMAQEIRKKMAQDKQQDP